jgi:hypothetical protein
MRNMKSYLIAGLLSLGVAATSFAQSSNVDSINQSSTDSPQDGNSWQNPEKNTDYTYGQDDASSSTRNPNSNGTVIEDNSDSIGVNSSEDNRKDAKYYGDSSSSKRMKSSSNMKSTGGTKEKPESSTYSKNKSTSGKGNNGKATSSAKNKKTGSTENNYSGATGSSKSGSPYYGDPDKGDAVER